MRSFDGSLSASARFGRRASLGLAAALLLCATAWGQSTALPFDSRYGLPPETTAESAPAEEPLLSYRREDAPPTAAEIPAAATDSSPTGSEESNPLRRSPEPPQFPPIQSTPADPVAQPTNPILEASTSPPMTAPAAVPSFTIEQLPRYDAAVEPAVHESAPPKGNVSELPTNDLTEDNSLIRHLAPPSSESATETASATSESKSSPLPFSFSKLESLSTAGAGLAIVVGLFLVCMWMLRRSGPKASSMLPTDAFAVLGRAPLTAQSFAHLLRVGNKLVLVAMTPDGVQPLTEVTDPMEVDRLTGLCASGRGHGPSAEFQQVLAQLSREPARGFLGADATSGGRRR